MAPFNMCFAFLMCFGLFLCFFCRTAADYYDVVTTPIDLLKIQQKLKTDEYDDIDLLTNDVRLMINNAKAYYKVCACFSSSHSLSTNTLSFCRDG